MADALQGVRSRDLKKQEFEWVDPKIIHEFSEGHELAGYKVAYLDDPKDLAYLGERQGHCAGTHFIWACEEKIWYFFAILGPNGQPHVTIHAKQTKWIGKAHPRDSMPSMAPDPYGNGTLCYVCRGAGDVPGVRGYVRCTACNGRGVEPPKKDQEVPIPYPRASRGSYPTFDDVVKAFASVGRKYEAGKYRALTYNSQTYEGSARGGDPQVPSWDRKFNNPFAKRDMYGEPAKGMIKPDHVTDEQWATFTQVWKEMKDTHDKNLGAVKIVGRPFKFDGKDLTILSFSGKGQTGGDKYRKGFHECLVELAKAKKKEVVSGS